MSQPILIEGQDEDYECYLFCPSLSSRDVSSGPGDIPSSPLYGPVSFDSESTDYDYSVFSSGPPSPIIFVTTPGFRSGLPLEPDFGSAPSGSHEAGAESEPVKEHKKTSEPAKYSPIFKLGFYLSQMTHLVNRAIDGVKIKTRKPRSQAP